MKELIKITEKDGKIAVNAREIHAFLESKQEFANWIKGRIEKYGFVENQVFVSFDNVVKRETGATVRKEYALSIDMAKEPSNQKETQPLWYEDKFDSLLKILLGE